MVSLAVFLSNKCRLWGSQLTVLDALLALMRLFGSAPRDLLHLSNVKDVIFAQFWFRWGTYLP